MPSYGKKCATDGSLIREPLGSPFSLVMRFSESLSMTTDVGLFRTIFDRMSIFKSLKIKVLSPISRKSVESQIGMFTSSNFHQRRCPPTCATSSPKSAVPTVRRPRHTPCGMVFRRRSVILLHLWVLALRTDMLQRIFGRPNLRRCHVTC